MGASIDALGQAAGHRQSPSGQFAGQAVGCPPTVGGRVSGTDDSHGRFIQRLDAAEAVKNKRRIANLFQQVGKGLVFIADDSAAQAVKPGFFFDGHFAKTA